ncbi:MAG: arsenate reductase (glutaredoxin) [Deltaproteobacteria bacterium]|nr:MAG: arsenate reductase (glutaredoxin) [Deltaproteobacteria bacterium]
MASYEIWHNPRCSKSRQTLERLRAAGIEPKIREYLKDPPSRREIQRVLDLLGFEDPRQLMRTKEPLYKELGLQDETRRSALIAALAEHPKLIERPVVIKDGKEAVLGRPPENVDALL